MNKSFKAGKILYLISLIFYLILTAFLILFLIKEIKNVQQNQNNINIAAFLIIGVIIFGVPGYSLITILDLISVILLSINFKKQENKNKKDKISLIKSSIFLILPIITEITFFVICNFLMK